MFFRCASQPVDENNADRLASRLFFALTLAFLVFVAIASLTPGHSAYNPLHKWRALWMNLFTNPAEIFSYHNLRDIATNVLLYLPLGLFLSLTVSYRRPRIFTPWLAAGTVISFIMEMIQAVIHRHSDPVDVMTNTSGFVLGFWMVVVAVKVFGLRPSSFLGVGSGDDLDQKTRSLASLRFLYVCLYLIVALVPFDISVSLSRIYGQLFPGAGGERLIVLDPLYHFKHWQAGGGLRLLLELLGLMPLAVLTTLLGRLRARASVWLSISACLILAGVSEIGQLFIMSRTSDILMLPLAVIAGLLGWRIGHLWMNITSISDAAPEESDSDRVRMTLLALAGYALVICLLAWAPYRFEIELKEILRKIRHESNLVPFKLHFDTRSLGSAVDIVKEAGIFVPLGLLITLFLRLRLSILKRSGMIIITALACFGFGVLVELSQAACAGRYIDVTDMLLAGAGGLAGAVLFGLFARDSRV